jgi:hypothetical protein
MTQPTLTLSSVLPAQAGLYTCRVRNTAGDAVSNPARLIVQLSFEQWRVKHFTSAERTDLLISGLIADPDGDGLSNLQEFFHGLDPHQADSAATVGVLPELGVEEGNPRYVTLTFRRSAAAFVSAAMLEKSASLLPDSWTVVPSEEMVEESTLDEASGDSRVRWKLPRDPLGPRQFLRLRLLP